MVFHFVSTSADDVGVDLVLLILLLEEIADELEHRPDVIIRSAEMRVLIDRHLESLNLLTKFGDMV